MQYDRTQLTWRKSSHSSGNGQCLEVGDGLPNVMPVRDSKNVQGPLILFSTCAWSAFVAVAKTGALSTGA
ncbi:MULTISPECIES: DUF397 domain-containing protein [unclassified Streptomyces]|uniref:DUF397 domain-containing protein n=1 Tax=unclassified Streptomyces TaxID=2593676 RepID=UPI0036E2178A